MPLLEKGLADARRGRTLATIMSWLHKLERRLEPLAVHHVVLALVAGQTFFYLAEMFQLVGRDRLVLAWGMVAQGEWWRLFSFVLVPPNAHWVFIAFALYILYFLGSALEEAWGTLRLNLFLLSGWVLTVAAAWIVPTMIVSNLFIGGSLFLAFAYLNPNYTFHLFLILPVKVKWLAIVMWAFYAITLVGGDMGARVLVLAATGNFFLFFGSRMIDDLRGIKRQAARRRSEKVEAAAAGPRHQCCVCAKNSDTHPDEDFRYRADGKCYCEEHLRAAIAEEAKRS
jgi:hypothetical protein